MLECRRNIIYIECQTYIYCEHVHFTHYGSCIFINLLNQELDELKNTSIPDLEQELDTLKSVVIPEQTNLINFVNEELDDLNNITLPEQKELIESQNNEIDILKSNPVPIGCIYIELHGQPRPGTLWPNTEWENIAKYSGLFFKAEGGQSSPFGQIQGQQTQSIYISSHSIDNNPYWHGPMTIT